MLAAFLHDDSMIARYAIKAHFRMDTSRAAECFQVEVDKSKCRSRKKSLLFIPFSFGGLHDCVIETSPKRERNSGPDGCRMLVG